GFAAEDKWLRQPLSITSFDPVPGESERFLIQVETPPFSQLQPQAGDRFQIPFDLDMQVTWTYNGLQRLFYPRTSGFHIYRQKGPLHTLRGLVTRIEVGSDVQMFTVHTDVSQEPGQLLDDSWCQIGASLYKIMSQSFRGTLTLTVEYQALPIIVPQQG